MDALDLDSILHLIDFSTTCKVITTRHAGDVHAIEHEQVISRGLPRTPPSRSVLSFVDGSTSVSVSTTFYPAANLSSSPPDLILQAADSVFFYVHRARLLAPSENHFARSLPLPIPPLMDGVDDGLGPIVVVDESATVLNIVMRTFYDMPLARYPSSLGELIIAVDALAKYGAPPKAHVAQSMPLYRLLLEQSPRQPIAVYVLAAHYDLYDLAVAVSSYLLSFSLADLTNELASRIGPLYLKRLFFLHFGRVATLKSLLHASPRLHSPTTTCGFAEQKTLTTAWSLASAYLAWNARPDTAVSDIRLAMGPLEDRLSCDLCKATLKERVDELIVRWTLTKRTISP